MRNRLCKVEDNKQEQERSELYRTIWGIANDLRGSVDGWFFKQYVLGMLFYRYISENLKTYINKGEIEAGTPDFDYASLSDEEAKQAREDLVCTKGFLILPSELFENAWNEIAIKERTAWMISFLLESILPIPERMRKTNNFI